MGILADQTPDNGVPVTFSGSVLGDGNGDDCGAGEGSGGPVALVAADGGYVFLPADHDVARGRGRIFGRIPSAGMRLSVVGVSGAVVGCTGAGRNVRGLYYGRRVEKRDRWIWRVERMRDAG